VTKLLAENSLINNRWIIRSHIACCNAGTMYSTTDVRNSDGTRRHCKHREIPN